MLRQCLILIPCILIFGKTWGLWGVIAATPVADALSFIITGIMISFELKKLRSIKTQAATVD
jgi:Na+-driven multidrug efflux pump